MLMFKFYIKYLHRIYFVLKVENSSRMICSRDRQNFISDGLHIEKKSFAGATVILNNFTN